MAEVRIVLLISMLCVFFGDISAYTVRRRRRGTFCSRVDGGWSSWSSYTTCSCNTYYGTGTRTRYRQCNNPSPYCSGLSCSGAASETARCDSECCARIDGRWEEWGKWGQCTCNHATGTGTWTRNRTCSAPSCGGHPCYGNTVQTGTCDNLCCKRIDGGWSVWEEDGTCQCDNKTGTGRRNKTRECTNPSPVCEGEMCPAPNLTTVPCDEECCKSRDGNWGLWGSWGICECDYITGNGTKTRARSCDKPVPECGGAKCEGTGVEPSTCDEECCKTKHGGWGGWTLWGECTCDNTTGTGTRNKTRNCSDPPPDCGGRECSGHNITVESCDEQCCKTEHGQWGQFEEWTQCVCDHGTGTGKRTRTRSCDSPAPVCGGRGCPEGGEMEVGQCDEQCCKTVSGEWGKWRTAEECTCNYTTGTGTTLMKRACNQPVSSCGGDPCPGADTKTEPCETVCCVTKDGSWSEWSEWSPCNCTRGGEQERNRTCSRPLCYGEWCQGDESQLLDCSGNCSVAQELGQQCGKSEMTVSGKCVSWLLLAIPVTVVCAVGVLAAKLRRKKESSPPEELTLPPVSPPINPTYSALCSSKPECSQQMNLIENDYFFGSYDESEPIYTNLSDDDN